MSVPSISFFVAASVAVLAAGYAMLARDPRRSLASFAVGLCALLVPLVQLRAASVAGLVLLAAAVLVALLGGLAQLGSEAARTPAPPSTRAPAYWVLSALGLAGFVWVILATGSRQVIEAPAPLPQHAPGPAGASEAGFGDGPALLSTLVESHSVAAAIVGLLALASVIAAVLTLVAERDPTPDVEPS